MLQLDQYADLIKVTTAPSAFSMRHGRKLPRLRKPGAAYAVTFRLPDSLPASVTNAWQREREELCSRAKDLGRDLTESEQARLTRLFSSKVDAYLAAGHGECVLRDQTVAEVVERSLLHYDGQRYFVGHWCLMPNHVHAILWPMPNFELDDILHAMESYTAHAINRHLGRRGEFWLEESYDHLIRDDLDLWHTVRYIDANPVKAKLKDWKWCGSKLTAEVDGVRIHQEWQDQFDTCYAMWADVLGKEAAQG